MGWDLGRFIVLIAWRRRGLAVPKAITRSSLMGSFPRLGPVLLAQMPAEKEVDGAPILAFIPRRPTDRISGL
jgi:hypothetical protein